MPAYIERYFRPNGNGLYIEWTEYSYTNVDDEVYYPNISGTAVGVEARKADNNEEVDFTFQDTVPLDMYWWVVDLVRLNVLASREVNGNADAYISLDGGTNVTAPFNMNPSSEFTWEWFTFDVNLATWMSAGGNWTAFRRDNMDNLYVKFAADTSGFTDVFKIAVTYFTVFAYPSSPLG